MDANVHQAHIAVKPDCAWSGMEGTVVPVHDTHMRPSPKKKPLTKVPESVPYQRTFMRPWRKSKGKTLEVMGAKLGMTHGQLSKIETGQQPYSQRILETYATELGCTVIDLLTREPGEAEHILSLWMRADGRGRKTIAAVAKSVLE